MKSRAAKSSPVEAGTAPEAAQVRRKAGAASASRAGAAGDVIVAPALSSVVGYLLRRSHNAFQGYWMARFYGPDRPITPVQGGMLVVLGSNPGITQTELARIMNVEGPTLMQSIDRLEDNGYVLRTRRAGDRRSNSLQLTPQGLAVLKAIEDFLPIRDADLLTDLSDKEIAQLAQILTKIVARAHARMREMQEEEQAAQAASATPLVRRRGAVR